mmetsp:Transcript_27127/g.23993  ORF Transcript_27127/g.23993 Transcript_27127/m.23993 type:complete len:180 (-) Transcript_27127:26-565(-)
MFIARSIFDGYFNAVYILHAEVFDSSNEDQLRVLKFACSYLSLFPLDELIPNIWGCATSNKELGERFDELSESFNKGESTDEIIKSLQDLECKFYYHEFIKRLLLFHTRLNLDEVIDNLKLKKFIVKLLNVGILSKSQFDVGLKNTKNEILKTEEDPKLKESFKTLMDECLANITYKYE